MPSSELVSVIIPLYNAASFIEETLNSVLSQSLKELKVYVIDDFSNDGSAEIVKKIAEREPRLKYYLMPKKGGCPAPTKNEGVRLSQGEFVAFCDHDDWWESEKLAQQVDYLQKNKQVNLLGCNVEIIDTEHGTSLGTFWHNPNQITEHTIRQLVLDGPIFATTTCIIGRREYLSLHPFDTQLLGSDEYDLSLHAVLDDPKQVAVLTQTLAYWRWHSASLSHSDTAASRALKDETLFAEKILARSDLLPAERAQVKARVIMVTRRAANAELAQGDTETALHHYRIAVAGGDRISQLLLLATLISPKLTARFVSWKRSRSHAQPSFR